MEESFQLIVKRSETSRWHVEHPVSVPSHEPVSERDRGMLTRECAKVCIPPVRAQVSSDAVSNRVIAVKLGAEYSSEADARSPETEQAFRRSDANVTQVLERRLMAG